MLQASINGVLGVQKRKVTRRTAGGAHELSGIEDDGGEDSDDPEEYVRGDSPSPIILVRGYPSAALTSSSLLYGAGLLSMRYAI
jgi:hypothetical protein